MEHTDFIVQFLKWFNGSYPYVGQLLVVMAIDISTGVLAASIEGKLNSSTGFAGMCRKAVMLLLVALGTALEQHAGDLPLAKLIALGFTVMEGISILENAGRAGVPIPSPLREILEKLRTDKPQPPTIVINPPQQNINVSAKNVSINPETAELVKDGTRTTTTTTHTESEPPNP